MAVNSSGMNLSDQALDGPQEVRVMRERIGGPLGEIIGIDLFGLFLAIPIMTVTQDNKLRGVSQRLPDPMAGTDTIGLQDPIAQYH